MLPTLLRFLGFALVLYGLLTGVVWLLAERVMFQPPASSYRAAQLTFTRIAIGDDSVAVLHLPNPAARYTILYSHGNAEDIGQLEHRFRALRDAGFGVLAYDYRGYGQSTGGPATADKAAEDAEAVYRHATGTLGIEPARLILYGRSVGSGPAMEVAARHDAAGVVLESAFTSAYRTVTRVRLFPFDRFPNIERVRALRRPLLVIHGTEDWIVPYSHGPRLFAAANEPKRALWVKGAGHNDVMHVAGARYIAALLEFAALLDESQGDLPR